jgi:hypothetical protein
MDHFDTQWRSRLERALAAFPARCVEVGRAIDGAGGADVVFTIRATNALERVRGQWQGYVAAGAVGGVSVVAFRLGADDSVDSQTRVAGPGPSRDDLGAAEIEKRLTDAASTRGNSILELVIVRPLRTIAVEVTVGVDRTPSTQDAWETIEGLFDDDGALRAEGVLAHVTDGSADAVVATARIGPNLGIFGPGEPTGAIDA